jgi:hypothetical protein
MLILILSLQAIQTCRLVLHKYRLKLLLSLNFSLGPPRVALKIVKLEKNIKNI